MPRLTIEPAVDGDVPAYLSIRDATAEQLLAAGVEQWRPGELTPNTLRAWMGEGQLFTARLDSELVGGLIVMWADPIFWGDQGDDAGYTHGLLVDRKLKGSGLGRELLTFAERHIGDNGRSLARLDTVSTNTVLRRYYRDAGYVEVGERVFEDGKVLDTGAPISSVTLFEKKLRG